jgi:hypothetical protein
MRSILILLSILIISVSLPFFININEYIKEGYTNNSNISVGTLLSGAGDYPYASNSLLVQDQFPLTGNTGISNNTSNDIWWHYPIFTVGSYAQITNNLKYPNNPDEGTCMPGSMCQTLYKEKQLKSNYIQPLPPVNPNGGTRINYYNTDVNLLPFRTDVPNILY